ncbi:MULTISPECIES: LysR family transcriptional regulator substrate-binding protein [Streptomyces]|uniref:LysR family transcriptional regulator substrate-binding protein n=1 Tax=Streptomyces fimbriatus TaxID=68197 RepID=A0ABW0D343_STRFI
MESLTSYRLPPLLEYLHHRYPRVRLALRTTIGDETRQALRQGAYDLGFLMQTETEHPGLEGEVPAVEPLALVAAPGHPASGAPVTTAALVRQPLLAEVTVAAELAEGSLVRLDWEPPFTASDATGVAGREAASGARAAVRGAGAETRGRAGRAEVTPRLAMTISGTPSAWTGATRCGRTPVTLPRCSTRGGTPMVTRVDRPYRSAARRAWPMPVR